MSTAGPYREPPPRRRKRPRIHKKRAASITPGGVKNEINVTPLVDVVLVLLIIFMVVTPMLHRGVHVELPETKNHAKKQDTGEQLVIGIKCDKFESPGHCAGESSVYIETDKIEPDQLVDRVRRELKKARPVYVRADKSLKYGSVRKALEKLHEAGAQSIAMGTEEKK